MRRHPPCVTVAVPTHQYGHLLEECVASALAQDVTDLELLIVDNASTDDTPDVARALARSDPRVRYLRCEENVGYIGNVARCIEAARGEYLNVLAADDTHLRRDTLSRALAAFRGHPGLALFHSAYVDIDARGRSLRTVRWSDEDVLSPGRAEVRRLLDLRLIWLSSMVTRTDLARDTGGMDPAYGPQGDLGWCLNLCLRGPSYYDSTPLVTRRLHGDSINGATSRRTRQQFLLDALDAFAGQIEDDVELSRAYRESRALLLEHMRAGARAPEVASLAARVQALVSAWHRSGARVVVYGAGDHTRALLATTRLGEATLVGLADRDAAKHGQRLFDLEVVPPASIGELAPDVVVVSSYYYQEQICADLAPLLEPDVELVRLYG